MAKVTVSTIAGAYASTTELNANFSALATAVQNQLSLDSSDGEANALISDLDANSKRIYNAPTPTTATDVVNKAYVDNLISPEAIASSVYEYQALTATAGQTAFTFTTVSYNTGVDHIHVYINGVYQTPTGYTKTSSTVITTSEGLDADDVLLLVVQPVLATAETSTALVTTYSPSGAGAVDTNVQAKLRETVSVKDFGAAGDGVTDDTAAFNLLIAAVNSRGTNGVNTGGGTKINIPAGTYQLLSGLDAITVDGAHWVGAGLDATYINAQTGTVFLFSGVSLVDSVSVRDMSIVCNSALTPSDTLTAVKLVHGTRLTIDNIKIIRVPKLFLGVAASGKLISNIKISNIVGQSFESSVGEAFIECDVATGGSGAGLYLDSIRTNLDGVAAPAETDGSVAHTANSGCTAIYIHGLWDTVIASDIIFNRYHKGLHIVPNTSQTCSNIYFNQCIFDYCAENAIHLNNASGNTTKFRFIGGWLNSTEGDTVSVERAGGLVDSLTFKGCDFLNAGLHNIDIAADCTGITIEDNTFFGCGRKQLTSSSPTKTSNTINIGASCDGLSIEGNKCVDGFSYYGAGSYPLASGDYDGANGVEISNIAMGFSMLNNIMRGATAAYGFTSTELFATSNTEGRYLSSNVSPASSVPEYIGVSTAAAPATTVAETNLTGCKMTVYIRGGTVSVVKVNGNSVLNDTNTSIVVDPGATWAVTYSSTPSIVRHLMN